MKEISLFTDGSVNTKSKIGYGAYLVISDENISLNELKRNVKVKRFDDTSSTKLELQTLLWALNEIKDTNCKVNIYTDSQNIIGLSGRRERLESNNYLSAKNKLISNFSLYQEFYRITDSLNCKLIKVQGHLRSSQKDYIQEVFTIVDRASRNATRNYK